MSKWVRYKIEGNERSTSKRAPYASIYALWRFDALGKGERSVLHEFPQVVWAPRCPKVLDCIQDMLPVSFKSPEEMLDWLVSNDWQNWNASYKLTHVINILM